MSAIASGWNVIVRKKTLEDNNYNLRKVEIYPGTGPFKSVKRVENESWLLEKNPNYWNKGLPYLDEVQFFHALPFSTELGSAILSGRVDYIRITDPVTARKAAQTPGMKTTAYNQSVIQGTWINGKKKPFDDPRVRRALHLAFDRPTLIEVVKDVTPMQVGGFIYPFSDFATPKENAVQAGRLSGRPGRGDQGSQAAAWRRPVIANGINGLDFLVRDVPSFKLWAQAIQAMLQEGAQRPVQFAHDRRVGLVRRYRQRPFRPGDRRHRLDAARPVGLFQCLVPHRRAAELFDVAQREIRRAGRSDRPRGRSRQASRTGAPDRGDHGAGSRRCCRSPGRRSTMSGTIT